MNNNVSQVLLQHLVDKAFEGLSKEEKLAFVEKLFTRLSPTAQQEFLLRLAQEVMTPRGGEAEEKAFLHGPPWMRRMAREGPRGFGPWQMCYRVMSEFVQAPRADAASTATVARVFNALADPTRLKIIKILAEGEKSVDELVQMLGIAQSTTSHHLRVLREAGLVQGVKRGRNIYYSLTQPLEEPPQTAV